jgi:hypothetical protein
MRECIGLLQEARERDETKAEKNGQIAVSSKRKVKRSVFSMIRRRGKSQ